MTIKFNSALKFCLKFNASTAQSTSKKLNSAHYIEVWRDFGRENGFVYRHIAPLVLQGDDDIVVKLVFVGYAFDFVAYDSDGVGDFLVFCFVFVCGDFFGLLENLG